MTVEQTENFHLALLRVLDANGSRFGLGTKALALLVNEYGFAPKLDEVERAMEYLGDDAIGFVGVVGKGNFNPANHAWKITAKGINELRTRGF